jgi:hypothetical protein
MENSEMENILGSTRESLLRGSEENEQPYVFGSKGEIIDP